MFRRRLPSTCVALLAAIVLLNHCTAAAKEISARDQEDAAYSVLQRVIGDKSIFFNLTIDTTLKRPAVGTINSNYDTFVVAASGGIVRVRAPSGASLAAGAYWYLKNVTKCIVTWGEDRTGDQVSLPGSLPDVAMTTIETIVPWRYAWNMCTFGYTSTWWGIDRWTREIDWMALHGINMPLALIGQEHVWMILFQRLGVPLADLESWFSGPAFLPWQRAGNIRGFAGPLSAAFIEQQRLLQKSILSRMRALGMTPVLPCFSGHVPAIALTVFPNMTATQSPAWNNFAPNETNVYIVDPTEPAFKEIGKLFMQIMVEEFGASNYYSCDTFNEVDPTTTNSTYLKDAATSVVESIRAVDPAGVWVLQAWLFHFGFWTQTTVEAYLSGAPQDALVILDLNSEDGALAPKFAQYYGHYWIWNMLHNYGGVRGMYGNLSRIATGPLIDLNAPGSAMIGIGFTPEAIEQNPVMYEMLTSTFYAAEPIQVVPWLQAYVLQRYGSTEPQLWAAWQALLADVYSQAGEPRTELEKIPTWQNPNFGWQNAKPDGMVVALKAMLAAAQAMPYPQENGPFQYDLVDVARQASTMFFTDVHRVMSNILIHAWYSNSNNISRAYPSMDMILELIDALDDLLGTNPNYLLGTWTTRATSLAANDAEAANFMYNARNQITLWGPDGQITDYAAKAWAGLYRDYYKPRWGLMFATLKQQGVQQWNSYSYRQLALLPQEQAWCVNSTAYPASTNGVSGVDAAARLLGMISTNLTAGYVRYNNSLGGTYSGQYNPMWTRAPEQLGKLCDLDPLCEGFNSDGALLKDIGKPSKMAGYTLWVKRSPPSPHK